jgi:hypothetical protein
VVSDQKSYSKKGKQDCKVDFNKANVHKIPCILYILDGSSVYDKNAKSEDYLRQL